MKTRSHNFIFSLALGCILIATASARSQEKKTILMMPGDINIPYYIISGFGFVKEVKLEVSLLGSNYEKSYNSALNEVYQYLPELAKANGADAIIDLHMQFVPIPATHGAGSGININELFVYGALVKYRTAKSDTLSSH